MILSIFDFRNFQVLQTLELIDMQLTVCKPTGVLKWFSSIHGNDWSSIIRVNQNTYHSFVKVNFFNNAPIVDVFGITMIDYMKIKVKKIAGILFSVSQRVAFNLSTFDVYKGQIAG